MNRVLARRQFYCENTWIENVLIDTAYRGGNTFAEDTMDRFDSGNIFSRQGLVFIESNSGRGYH